MITIINMHRILNILFVVLIMWLPVAAINAAEQQLNANDGSDFDAYGSSVSVDGDTAIIGAHKHNGMGTDSGAAYIAVRYSAGSWVQQVKLTAAENAAFDHFGSSVAISGNLAIVGAPGADIAANNSGAAYIFIRDDNNIWHQQSRLTASDGEYLASFGGSVSISGNTAIVGAKSATNSQLITGAAYIFVYDGSNWIQQAKLIASDGAEWDSFGRSVSLSGDTAVIGATSANVNGFASGAAYVFVRVGSVWSEQAKLLADAGSAGDLFGNSVSISGDDILVGSFHEDTGAIDAGAAYVYTRTGSVWNQQAKLTAVDAAAYDYFGASVSIINNIALIGAYNFSGSGNSRGMAFVFERASANWSQVYTRSPSDATNDQRFGFSVAASVDSLFIGASSHAVNGVGSGAAYYYPNDVDIDGDGTGNVLDNCPLILNTDQLDTDTDGIGDLCDGDMDGDGVDNSMDNCQLVINPGQENFDGDSTGDICDGDDDNDGVSDEDEGIAGTSPFSFADTDLDRMSDDWENINGTNAAIDDALEDSDNDGFVNILELIKNSSPQDQNSVPTINTFYVDIANTSGIENGSQANPFRSIVTAIAQAQAGDTVSIAPGNYDLNFLLLNKPLRLIGSGVNSTILSFSYFYPVGLSWAQVENLTFSTSYFNYLYNSRNIVYRDCRISAVQGTALTDNAKAVFQNCVLDGGAGTGTGISLETSSDLVMINTTLTDYETGISVQDTGSELTIHNSILANSTQDLIGVTDSSGIRYSLITDGQFTGSNGNISDSPLFSDSDFHLQASSPAIDAGDPVDNFNNEAIPSGCRINMGAYGNTSEAAISSDVDSDTDGLTDRCESLAGTDPANPDSDSDGLTDGIEDANGNGVVDDGETNPLIPDTDGDGLSDAQDNCPVNINVGQEDVDGDFVGDICDADNDNDGVSDEEEGIAGTNPLVFADTDKDRMSDDWENIRGTNAAIDDALEDSDNDGFVNVLEFIKNSLPLDEYSVPSINTLYVDIANTTGIENGSQANPFSSMSTAVAQAQAGDTIKIAPGDYNLSFFSLTKPLRLTGSGIASTILSPTYFYPVGLSWAQIENLTISSSYFNYPVNSRNIVYRDCRISAVQGTALINNSKVVFQNCVLDGGAGTGTGISLESSSDLVMINTTLTDYDTGISVQNVGSELTIHNSILANNTQDLIGFTDGSGIHYSLMTDGQFTGSNGNISGSPLFSDIDFHLQASSPAIDAGDPVDNFNNEAMPSGCRINMGAYGNTSEAITSFDADSDADGLTDRCESLAGTDPANPDSDSDGLADGVEDANGNGVVDVGETDPNVFFDTDGDRMSDDWETVRGTDFTVADGLEDLDGDGFVNILEFLKGSLPLDEYSVPLINTFYVDQSNVSGVENGSQTNPYISISSALTAAENGDTLQLASGNYNLGFFYYNKSVRIRGAGVGVTNLSTTYFLLNGVSWSLIENLTIDASYQNSLPNARNVIYRDCRISALQGTNLSGSSDALFQNCVLDGGNGTGTGIDLVNGNAVLINTTLADFAIGVLQRSIDSSISIQNSIVSNYVDLSGIIDGSNIRYSQISDGQFSDNNGNISGNPLFSDLDYHLHSESLAIDAGDQTDDFSNEPVPSGCRINMGAYGNTAQATVSSDPDLDNDGLSSRCETIAGTDPVNPDSDGDGLVDGVEDINANGVVDFNETDPLNFDTDADGVSDGIEVEAGTDPLLATSYPVLNDGDVNNDGNVDIADLILASRIITGHVNPTLLQATKLDVAPLIGGVPEPDGQLTAGDYMVLSRKVMGLIDF